MCPIQSVPLTTVHACTELMAVYHTFLVSCDELWSGVEWLPALAKALKILDGNGNKRVVHVIDRAAHSPQDLVDLFQPFGYSVPMEKIISFDDLDEFCQKNSCGSGASRTLFIGNDIHSGFHIARSCNIKNLWIHEETQPSPDLLDNYTPTYFAGHILEVLGKALRIQQFLDVVPEAGRDQKGVWKLQGDGPYRLWDV